MSDFVVSDRLIAWYEEHKRELPWRETTDPYAIWISEIILQQTRVAQGLEYYRRFMKQFPTAKQLSEAQLDDVLLAWQGLGYYTRARNLHTAARQIAIRFKGRFPSDYTAIRSLKGVGDYTAAAIASFAFEAPYAVLDGNVYRVLSRLLAIDTPIDSSAGKRLFQQEADKLLNTRRSALHNQAIMELGALQCVPSSPDCTACPLSEYCLAYRSGTVDQFPVKASAPKIRERWFYYFIFEYRDTFYLHQRLLRDVWSHLYEFPLIECAAPTNLSALTALPQFRSWVKQQSAVSITPVWLNRKHILSHQHIYADFYNVKLAAPWKTTADYVVVPRTELDRYPVSRLMSEALERFLDSK